jgi:hypothetical protein
MVHIAVVGTRSVGCQVAFSLIACITLGDFEKKAIKAAAGIIYKTYIEIDEEEA